MKNLLAASAVLWAATLTAQVNESIEVRVVNVDVEYSPWSNKATMVQRGEQRGADVNIEDADILVAGGRGLGAQA